MFYDRSNEVYDMFVIRKKWSTIVELVILFFMFPARALSLAVPEMHDHTPYRKKKQQSPSTTKPIPVPLSTTESDQELYFYTLSPHDSFMHSGQPSDQDVPSEDDDQMSSDDLRIEPLTEEGCKIELSYNKKKVAEHLAQQRVDEKFGLSVRYLSWVKARRYEIKTEMKKASMRKDMIVYQLNCINEDSARLRDKLNAIKKKSVLLKERIDEKKELKSSLEKKIDTATLVEPMKLEEIEKQAPVVLEMCKEIGELEKLSKTILDFHTAVERMSKALLVLRNNLGTERESLHKCLIVMQKTYKEYRPLIGLLQQYNKKYDT